MYKIGDRAEAIREIQKNLALIYGGNIFPTGIYDDETINGVKKIQEENGIEATGRVDLITFMKITDEARKKVIVRSAEENSGHRVSFPVSFGDSYPEIAAINEALMLMLDHYGIEHSVRGGYYFGKKSADAAREARWVYGIADGETVDEELYERLRTDLEAIKIR